VTIDLEVLGERVRGALPQLSCELVELEHAETRDRYRALAIETEERVKDCVYRMTIAVIDAHVNFFVHVHGTSRDLTTRGAQHFTKACADADEVFAIVCSCWIGAQPS
jgi:hypothetical protein